MGGFRHGATYHREKNLNNLHGRGKKGDLKRGFRYVMAGSHQTDSRKSPPQLHRGNHCLVLLLHFVIVTQLTTKWQEKAAWHKSLSLISHFNL